MAQVENLEAVITFLKKKKKEAEEQVKTSCKVGYTAEYAIYVHENLESYHPNGQAKYLEQPAREKQDQIAKKIRDALKNGSTFEEALLIGGLYLQRESQELVPVLTGNLRGSAFTELVKE